MLWFTHKDVVFLCSHLYFLTFMKFSSFSQLHTNVFCIETAIKSVEYHVLIMVLFWLTKTLCTLACMLQTCRLGVSPLAAYIAEEVRTRWPGRRWSRSSASSNKRYPFLYLWCDQFADIGQDEMLPFADSGHKAKSHCTFKLLLNNLVLEHIFSVQTISWTKVLWISPCIDSCHFFVCYRLERRTRQEPWLCDWFARRSVPAGRCTWFCRTSRSVSHAWQT
jgi:hypothetical protein